MAVKFVVMNDTRGEHHFGCDRVMWTIERLIHARGGIILAFSGVRNDWEADQPFLAQLRDADVILINGEGTLHHGLPDAERLLRVVDHPARRNTPVCIVNALFQENPEEWRRFVEKTSIFATRDSRSADEVQAYHGPQTFQSLDYSLYEDPGPIVPLPERALNDVIGDSVSKRTTQKLADLSKGVRDATFIPVMRTIKPSRPHLLGLHWVAREAYVFAHREKFRFSQRNVRFCKDQFDYLGCLRRARRHLTGRFHALCLSLLTETPVAALPSNSWKNEQLIADIGLNPDRIVSWDEIDSADPLAVVSEFSDQERVNLRAALARSRESIDATFDAIFDLVP